MCEPYWVPPELSVCLSLFSPRNLMFRNCSSVCVWKTDLSTDSEKGECNGEILFSLQQRLFFGFAHLEQPSRGLIADVGNRFHRRRLPCSPFPPLVFRPVSIFFSIRCRGAFCVPPSRYCLPVSSSLWCGAAHSGCWPAPLAVVRKIALKFVYSSFVRAVS